MKIKKLATVALTAVMALNMCATSFAAETTQENGDYTGTIHFYKATDSTSLSMCDSIFSHTANVELTADATELTFYVAYPIPAFSSQGTDGTVKDVKMTFDGTEYTGVSDIETKAKKTFDTTGALFGIKAGDELPTQAVTVSLPRTAADSLDDGIETSAYVNVVMNATQQFCVKVTDLAATNNTSKPAEDTKAEDTKAMDITANVEAVIPKPSYTVTVPESTAFGKLSAEKDNSQEYGVTVKATDLNGKLTIQAPTFGKLTSEENELVFTNTFGTQVVDADTEGTTLNGTLGVAATAVKAAVAGNYTGTTTFTISYAAN